MNRARLNTPTTVPGRLSDGPAYRTITLPAGTEVDILRDLGGLDTRLVTVWVLPYGIRRLIPANHLERLP